MVRRHPERRTPARRCRAAARIMQGAAAARDPSRRTEPVMQPERYELTFDATETTGEPGGGPAAVTVIRTQQTGPGGAPLYRDETGIVQAEINPQGEIRMLPTSTHQSPSTPRRVTPLPD
ncbi:hypothetical protein SSBG_01484 [Streptomyces sp. SPB074]|nr:hypothetical protein SSBG_01484 [Streptomyces sp. SPB074]